MFTPELDDEICTHVACGESMRTICANEAMPSMSTVFKWLRENEEFSQHYARAKEDAADAMAEEILDIADDASNDWMIVHKKDDSEAWQLNGEHVQRSRLRVDTRKFLMSKMKPKKYGDKLDVESRSEVTHKFKDMTDEQLDQLIQARQDRAA